MIANQASRAAPIQGVVYATLIAGNLWLLTRLLDVQFEPPYLVLMLLSAILGFFVFRRFDLTVAWRPGSMGSIGTQVLISWAWMVAALMFTGLLTKGSETFSRILLLSWIVSTPLLLMFAHLIARYALRQLAPQTAIKRGAVIVFANDSARVLAEKLQASHNYELLGYFDDRDDERTGGGLPDVKLLGKARMASQYVRDHEVQVVFVVLPDSGARRAISVLDQLGDTTASLYYVPDFFVFSLLKAQVTEVETVPVLQVAESPFYGVDGLLKQLFDYSFALFALILIAPLMLGLALAVKLSSPGPVLFRQKRYGLNGKRFWVYKFRSMVIDAADADKRQATRDDERITRVGRFIRKTSLDELPQFYNVLKGEMSVVGPRPHTVAHNEHYRKAVRRYMMRHKVKPGVTGWAQVNGLRGETANLERMEERIRFDLEYIRNWSPWLDIKIIFLTVWTVTRGDKNAY